jgi:GNAT superfamily N-acetyltransferase
MLGVFLAMSLRFRSAGAADAEKVALLHADSWRRNYRGAYAESYLDGDLLLDRLAVWSARLAAPAPTETILAEDIDRLVGFVHVVFDEDPAWGALVDNLHVIHDRRRTGIGKQLLTRSARAVTERAVGNSLYLWVLQQNTTAQQFYRACGARHVETALASPPGGDPTRLNGTPRKLRMAWSDASVLMPTLGPGGRPTSVVGARMSGIVIDAVDLDLLACFRSSLLRR